LTVLGSGSTLVEILRVGSPAKTGIGDARKEEPPMHRAQIQVLCACLLGGVLPGQMSSFVHPPQYKTIEGPGGTAIPFGVRGTDQTSRQFRYQQVHDSISPQMQVINSIRIRRDGASRFDWNWYLVEMEISASTSPSSAAGASATFAANIGQDVVTLMARTTVFFPGGNATGSFPEPFDYWLPCG